MPHRGAPLPCETFSIGPYGPLKKALRSAPQLWGRLAMSRQPIEPFTTFPTEPPRRGADQRSFVSRRPRRGKNDRREGGPHAAAIEKDRRCGKASTAATQHLQEPGS